MDTQIFAGLAAFLKKNSGLILGPDKTYLVQSRLQTLAQKAGFPSLDAFAAAVVNGSLKAWEKPVIEAMTTNETSFFRDNHPFTLFRSAVLPFLANARHQRKTLRILCAAASSGQEPYSLAMMLCEERLRLAGWKIEIVGIDLDTQILARAEEGLYTAFEMQRGLPVTFIGKYFEQAGEGQWRVKKELRDMISFRPYNLLHSLTPLGPFDVVFCRNVLIYFDEATKGDVLARLSQQMPDDGFLFLGGAETVLGITDRFRPVAGKRGVYVKSNRAADGGLAVAA
ncbi:MAG: CheR family methyltransferase [Rhodospirillaceae bacterium]